MSLHGGGSSSIDLPMQVINYVSANTGAIDYRPIKICLMHQTNLHPVFITCNMNKKRFTEFSNYLEGFTQRIVMRFPESRDFVNDEKTQMLERLTCKPVSPNKQREITRSLLELNI